MLGLFLIVCAAGVIAWAGGTSGSVVITLVIWSIILLSIIHFFGRNKRG